MFEVGLGELAIIAVIALLVLGPEKLPRAARMAGLYVRKARAAWYSVRTEIERELADEDLKRSLHEAGDLARSTTNDLIGLSARKADEPLSGDDKPASATGEETETPDSSPDDAS